MKKNNALDFRKEKLVKTGLCYSYDFIPEKRTLLEKVELLKPLKKRNLQAVISTNTKL